MSERPVFEPKAEGEVLVEDHKIEFTWHPGFSKEQKQKSIKSLHLEAKKKKDLDNILEVSTKSEINLGVKASAFNLRMNTKTGMSSTVESFYQGSKIFEKGGPFTDIYGKTSLESKKDKRLQTSNELVGFEFFGTSWGLNDHFYDWLYMNALLQNQELTKDLMSYSAYTDIEFNPKKSYNCQAYSLALYKSAYQRGYNLEKIKDPEKFKKLFPKEKLMNFQFELPL